MRRVTCTFTLAAILLGAAATPAGAAEPAAVSQQPAAVSREDGELEDERPFERSPAPMDAEPKRRWYGWQILLADAAVIPLCVRLGAETDVDLAQLGLVLVAIAVTPGVVHGLNGHIRRGVTSFFLRSAPLMTVFVAASLAPPPSGDGGPGGITLLATLVAGLGTAVYYVWEVSAHSTHVEEPSERRGTSWTVGAAPLPGGGATLGLGGSF